MQADAEGTFLEGLITSFESMSESLLSRLRLAGRKGAVTEMRAILHEYSGMCAVLGARKLTHLTQDLQRRLKDEIP